jgi:hypothetical protein
MFRNANFSTVAGSFYLAVYCVLLLFQNTREYALVMFLFSPPLIGWIVYTVLKYGKFKGNDLADDEFGYQDKSKDDLGVF